MVDQLQEKFESEGKPVYFLEHNTDAAPENRKNRFGAAYVSRPGVNLYLPLQVANSGWGGPGEWGTDMISAGGVNGQFERVYQAMVDRGLARTPEAEIQANFQRVGRNVNVQATIKNTSSVPFSSLNNAMVHAMLFEERKVLHTQRYVHVTRHKMLSEELAVGDSATFTFSFANIAFTEQQWKRAHIIVLIDYQPPGERAFKMAQAAIAIEGQPATPTTEVTPTPTETVYIPVPPTETQTPEITPTDEPPPETPTATDEPVEATDTPSGGFEIYLPLNLKNEDIRSEGGLMPTA